MAIDIYGSDCSENFLNMEMKRYTWKPVGHGAVDNLGSQVQKVLRTWSEFDNKETYIKVVERFVVFIAREFGLKKIANIKNAHLKLYADTLILDLPFEEAHIGFFDLETCQKVISISKGKNMNI